MELEQEAERATKLLKGKVVAKVTRHRAKEIGIEFADGTRLFIDHNPASIELSITDGVVAEIDIRI